MRCFYVIPDVDEPAIPYADLEAAAASLFEEEETFAAAFEVDTDAGTSRDRTKALSAEIEAIAEDGRLQREHERIERAAIHA